MHGVLAAGVRSNMDAVFLVFLIDWNTSVYFDRNKTLTLQKLALLSCKILGNVGWVKNVVDSTRFDRIDWSLWPRFTNEEGSCIFISRILTSGGLCRVGWKCCRFDSILSNRHESFPLLSIRHPGSRFARDTTPCESSRVVKYLRQIDSGWIYWTWMKTGGCLVNELKPFSRVTGLLLQFWFWELKHLR